MSDKRDADRSRTIVDGRLMQVSPTQIATFDTCELKWKFDKVDQEPRKPPGKGQLIGGEAHKQIEHWCETGEDVRSDLARLSDNYLRPFAPAIEALRGYTATQRAFEGQGIKLPARDVRLAAAVECELPHMTTPGGVRFKGYADLIVPPNMHTLKLASVNDDSNVEWPANVAEFDCSHLPVVIDHKFRSDVIQWAPRARALEDDEQAIVYSMACLVLWPDAQAVVFRHHNHQYRGRRFANVANCVQSADQIRQKFAKLCELVDRDMQRVAGAPHTAQPTGVEKRGCSAYGGCDYERICPHAPSNREWTEIRASITGSSPAAPQGNTTMTTPNPLETIFNNAMQGVPPTAQPQPTFQQTQPPTQPGFTPQQPMQAAPAQPGFAPQQPMQAAQPQFAPQQPMQAAPQPPTPAQPQYVLTDKCTPQRVYSVVGPNNESLILKFEGMTQGGLFFTDAQRQPKILPPNLWAQDLTHDPVVRQRFGLDAAPQAAAPQSVLPPDMPQTQPAQTQQQPTQPAQTQQQPAPDEKPKGKGGRRKKLNVVDVNPDGTPATKPAEDDRFVLCVDCSPVSGPDLDLTKLTIEAADKLAADNKLADLRLAPGEHALGFGRWRGALAAKVRELNPSGICVIRSGDLTDAVIEVLSADADMVIRAR